MVRGRLRELSAAEAESTTQKRWARSRGAGEAGADLGPGGPAGADSALRPEEGGVFSAPRAMAGAEEAFLALQAAGRGGKEETERARQATGRTGREMALRAARCSARVRRRAIAIGIKKEGSKRTERRARGSRGRARDKNTVW